MRLKNHSRAGQSVGESSPVALVHQITFNREQQNRPCLGNAFNGKEN